MKGLEAAIRNALAKAGHTDAHMRARIYQSARSALESGLRKQAITDPAVIAQQRHRLEALIESIEREERLSQTERMVAAENEAKAARVEPAYEPAPESHPEPEVGHDPSSAPEPHVEVVDEPDHAVQSDDAPSIDIQSDVQPDTTYAAAAPDLGGVEPEGRLGAAHPTETYEPESPEADAPDVGVSQDRVTSRQKRQKQPKPPKPRKRWRALAFSLVILVGFFAAAYWWADSSGLLLSPQERDTSVPNPPPTASEEDFEAPGLQSFKPERGFGEGWVAVYDPAKGDEIERGADVSADIKREGGVQFLQISAPAGGAGSSITVAVPQNTLREMAGNKSVIAISARGVSQDAQLSVTCNFGNAKSCERHRFTLSDDNVDLIFEVNVPADAGNSGAGKLTLNIAAGGADGEMELYGIHIEPKGEAGEN